MLIGVMTNGTSLESTVARTYAEADTLLIVDFEEMKILHAFPVTDETGEEPARKMIELDCEAVLCGPVHKKPFLILADEGAISRYLASGYTAREALRKMDAYELIMLTESIEGDGCSGAHSDGTCHEHG